MKAITIRQPWASAVADGLKDTENRSRPSKYRGLVLVHAGAAWSDRGATDPRILAAFHRYPVERGPRCTGSLGRAVPLERAAFTFGAVLAVVELVDCHQDVGCCRPWGESSYEEAGGRTQSTIFHYRFTGATLLDEPVAAKGQLGPLWTPSEDLVRAVQAQGVAV